jgi:hypothetical protein
VKIMRQAAIKASGYNVSWHSCSSFYP